MKCNTYRVFQSNSVGRKPNNKASSNKQLAAHFFKVTETWRDV